MSFDRAEDIDREHLRRARRGGATVPRKCIPVFNGVVRSVEHVRAVSVVYVMRLAHELAMIRNSFTVQSCKFQIRCAQLPKTPASSPLNVRRELGGHETSTLWGNPSLRRGSTLSLRSLLFRHGAAREWSELLA